MLLGREEEGGREEGTAYSWGMLGAVALPFWCGQTPEWWRRQVRDLHEDHVLLLGSQRQRKAQ